MFKEVCQHVELLRVTVQRIYLYFCELKKNSREALSSTVTVESQYHKRMWKDAHPR